MRVIITKRTLIFNCIIALSFIFVASSVAYSDPDTTFFWIACMPALLMLMLSLPRSHIQYLFTSHPSPYSRYYTRYARYTREERKEAWLKNFIFFMIITVLSLCISVITVFVTIFGQGAGLLPYLTNPIAAFLVVWVVSLVWFLIGIIITVSVYHIDVSDDENKTKWYVYLLFFIFMIIIFKIILVMRLYYYQNPRYI